MPIAIQDHVSSSVLGIIFPVKRALAYLEVASHRGSLQSLVDRGILKPGVSMISLWDRVSSFSMAMLLLIPVLGTVIVYVQTRWNKEPVINSNGPASQPIIRSDISAAIQNTPQFKGYQIQFPEGKRPKELGPQDVVHPYDLSIRPCQLFLESLGFPSTQPGSGELFAITAPLGDLRAYLLSQQDNAFVEISARGKQAELFTTHNLIQLSDYLGSNSFFISLGEIKKSLESQKIYVNGLPLPFFTSLQELVVRENMATLPNDESAYLSLNQVAQTPNFGSTPYSHFLQKLRDLIQAVKKDPTAYGFGVNKGDLSLDEVLSCSLYQLGALVLTKQIHYSFVNNDRQIRDRAIGDPGAFTLINACGVRKWREMGNLPGNRNRQIDLKILTATFENIFRAAGDKANLILPAMGLGVWHGDPEIYWTAFFTALVNTNTKFDHVLVNPGHQKTPYGKWQGSTGAEFARFLEVYHQKYPDNQNLQSVVNLFEKKTDIFLLAGTIPNAVLVNASDPDVTLGNHVGEYVNDPNLGTTTEENLTALGINGLLFKEMTGVISNGKVDLARVVR